MFFGINYYPESWDIKEVNKDIDKISELGFNCVRIGEFAWSTIEPREGEYDFLLLRKVVELCKEKHIFVIMCTPTATPPRWLVKKYPDIMAVSSFGQRMKVGARRDTCASSEVYLEYSKKIVEKLAKEFKNDENIIGWQIDNEMFAMRYDGLDCCCDHCADKFQQWMRMQFHGCIDECNHKMGNYVWSQNYSSFDDIEPPQHEFWNHPSLQLMWQRFQEENAIQYILAQYEILKKYVSVPIGHNAIACLHFDYDKLTKNLDVAMLDEYVFEEKSGIYNVTFWFDQYRAMKQKPFWLVETSPSWSGATVANYMKPYHFNKANVWLAYLSGAELVNYWLWRSHYGGQELMHGSVLSSDGKETHVVKEIKELVVEFEKAQKIFEDSELVKADIAIHLSSANFKMFLSQQITPDFNYYEYLRDLIYKPIRQAQYGIDLISPRGDIDDYKIVISPFLWHIDEGGMVEKALNWVENGGVWIVGPMSDIRTEYGTKLSDKSKSLEAITGITSEFYLPKGEEYSILFNDGEAGNSISIYYEALSPVDNATTIATYSNGEFIKGYPAVIEKTYGQGKIVEIGFVPDEKTLLKILSRYTKEVGINEPIISDKSVITLMRKGKETVLTAVETYGMEAQLKAPFNGVDILSEVTYKKDDIIMLKQFGTLLLKQIQ